MDEENLIKDIVRRYGEVIDLKKTPHLIIEILRTHGRGITEVPDAGVSVAGVGTPPGPAPATHTVDNVVDNTQLMKELLKLSKHVQLLRDEVLELKK